MLSVFDGSKKNTQIKKRRSKHRLILRIKPGWSSEHGPFEDVFPDEHGDFPTIAMLEDWRLHPLLQKRAP